ncbi:MAG: hypothetical protein U0Y08_10865 [Bacteroidia bacterium]
MKTPLYLIGILILLSGNLFAQAESKVADPGIIHSDVPTDYILGVPRMDTQKLLPLFKERIKSIEGLEFKGFCQSRGLIFFHGAHSQLMQVTQILDELGQNYFFKYDATLERAMNACESRSEITESLKTE